MPVRRALISVSDKAGIAAFARALSALGVEIVSTGGTFKLLQGEGIAAREISDLTGFPEMMDGRIKTLHPKVHGGLLAVRDNAEHLAAMETHGIGPIDLVVVNLYPFEVTVAKGAPYAEIIENIDIGGPAMIRSAAKNHRFVTVVVDPADYDVVLDGVRGGEVPWSLRQKLAAKAYARTAAYDAAISRWFAEEIEESAPNWLSFAGTLAQTMRYGENPHQSAAFYTTGENRPGVATARQVQGKELSYNNINDAAAAFELVSEFGTSEGAAVAIIKHANPCGVALGRDGLEAYRRALATDPVSAFGGIVALNTALEAGLAEEIIKLFTEVVIAPSASEAALALLAAKKNVRVLLTGGMADRAAPGLTVRSVAGGLLVQGRDNRNVEDTDLRIVTKRAPSAKELSDLKFAMKVAKHVKSNAIVYAKGGVTAAIGAGQMSRVDSTRIAHRKAEDAALAAGLTEPMTRGSVVASDAFFPFPDGLLAAVEAGATAVIQPGGSVNDDKVIAAADEAGIAMVFTGMRHFRH